MEMRKGDPARGTILFLLGLPFETHKLCTVITEREIVIGDQ